MFSFRFFASMRQDYCVFAYYCVKKRKLRIQFYPFTIEKVDVESTATYKSFFKHYQVYILIIYQFLEANLHVDTFVEKILAPRSLDCPEKALF